MPAVKRRKRRWKMVQETQATEKLYWDPERPWGNELVANVLADEGVEYVFAVTGGHVVGILDALGFYCGDSKVGNSLNLTRALWVISEYKLFPWESMATINGPQSFTRMTHIASVVLKSSQWTPRTCSKC